MDEDLPRSLAAGIYPAERAGELSFSWSHPLATITLPSLDRSVDWHCSVVARGARPGGVAQPEVILGVDGVTARRQMASNDFQSLDVVVPKRDGRGLALSVSASPGYVPGPGDPRSLGVQIDRIACRPDGTVLPGSEALSALAIAGAVFGLLFAVLCTSTVSFVGAVVLFSAGCATVVTTGPAAYVSSYLAWWLWVSAWVALTATALLVARDRSESTEPTTATRFVIGFSAAVLFLKIITLLHPSKDVVDALFHARRLGWVLEGRYYFTQPMPGGVQFPYAVGLYVASTPFASIIRDHIALLRIVVAVTETLAAMCVYVAVVRLWGDRLTAAVAAVIYHVVPLPYIVIGNANLTFAFGQSVAVIATVTAMLASRTVTRWALAGLFVVTTLAFLSHVAVFPLLAVTLVVLAALYWWTGDQTMRHQGAWIGAVAILAAILSIAVYYAHFPEVYRTLDRVGSPQTEPGSQPPVAAPAPTIAERSGRALYLGLRAFGLPVLVLTLAGITRLVRSAPRDRLTLALVASGIAMVVFLGFRSVAPVDARLQRYADEFIERVYYLTLAAVTIAAAHGFAWSWRATLPLRALGIVTLGAAVWIGVERWTSWIR